MPLICSVVAFLAGCSFSDRQSAEKYVGRTETKKIEGASGVGYDGTAMRKSVDNALDKNDSHNDELDKALKTGSDEPQKQ
jgi:hypothetical protein